jgi:hypothetical protein
MYGVATSHTPPNLRHKPGIPHGDHAPIAQNDDHKNAEKPAFARLFGIMMLIPTRRTSSLSELFCSENIIRGGLI